MGRAAGLAPLLAAALVASALSGCARVPDSGPAVPVAIPEASQSTDPTIGSVNAQLPEPSSDLDSSVGGYVNALNITRNPGPLGERYLATQALRNTFNQNTSMAVVRNRSIEYSVAADSAGTTATATFNAELVGTVDSDGVFTRADNSAWQAQVRMAQVRGFWLFSEPPPLIVQENQFSDSFTARTVYFAAHATAVTGPNPRLVIPEQRYVNVDIGGLATQVVDFVLAGPSDAMNRVAANPLQGIKRTSRVAVENNDLVIELEPQAEALNKDVLNGFVAAVGWSLSGVFYGEVRLLVGGRALDVEGFDPAQDERAWRRYNPAVVQTTRPAFQLQNGGVKVLSDPDVIPRPERLATPMLTKGVRSAAVSVDLRRFAIVRDDPAGGQRLWVADASGWLQPTLRAPQIGRPSWGGHRATVVVPIGGRVFEVGVGNAGTPSEIQVVGPGGRPLRDVTSVRLSLDGVRALIVAGTGSAARAYVGTLTGSSGGALVLGVRPLVVNGTPVDVSWWGPVTAVVAVAVQEQGNRVALVFAPVDGSFTVQTRALPNPGGPVRVSGDPAEAPDPAVLLEVGGKRHVQRQDEEPSGVAVAAATAPFYPG
ncbi:LpqB family beta-propeller domain-containing protein [Cryptosporangium sp. NPDC048952]|uniref:LpqB family beta-propeller domain-containing protein n=1 Tax=Cryptosporangium sp. NPDC048952 TaxID=3363961 RepID=UPI0037109707